MGEPSSLTAIVHDFRERLEWSQDLSDEPAWAAFYQRIWPTMTAQVRVDRHGAAQRDGVDRLVILRSGKEYRIDEKKRSKDYGDVLLEEWSVFYSEGSPRNKVGWALDADKHCDFIAYAVPSAQRCYFLPFELLRNAFLLNRSSWTRQFRKPDAQNVGYVTRNVAIPWVILRTEILRQMNRAFADRLELPKAIQHGSQIEFLWTYAEQDSQK